MKKQQHWDIWADFKIQYLLTRCMFTCDVQYIVKTFLVGQLHENQMFPPKGALPTG